MKTKDEILNQLYLEIKDIKQLIPVGDNQARKIAKKLRDDAITKNYFVPESKKILVPTKFFKKEIKL